MANDPGVSANPEAGPRLASLKRLWPYIRPYRGLVLVTLFGALGATLVQIAIPLITQDVIDGPIADLDKAGLIPLGLLALAFGVAEAFLFFLRRWAMTKSSLAMERDLRDHIYAHLLRLPVAFHDRWSSGQLLSRASSDVSSIRRFVGFSAIFLVVNIVSCIVIMVLLIGIYWPLGIFSAVCAIPLIFVGVRFERRYNVVSRQVQDQQGELATDVEEFDGHYERGRRLEGRGRFEEANGEYEKAVALYRGDYLLEDLYEDWTMVERERLVNAYVDMLGRLAEHYMEADQPQEGIRACYRILEKDRCHEDSYRLLMQCYARLGLRGRALRQYRLCESTLGREYGMAPSSETRALYELLLRDENG